MVAHLLWVIAYKFMYNFMHNFMYKFMYNFMYNFMYKFMYKSLGSGPGPRPQWELGQDRDQGPAMPWTRAQQLPLRPWAQVGSQASICI